MYTDSLIEILALLDLSTLHKISSKNKRLFDIYNCDRFWRMKLANEDLLGLDYLIDPLYSNSTSKEIYEQYEKYQKRFDILSNEFRRHELNRCYPRLFLEEYKCSTVAKKLFNQRDDIKTLSFYNKHLKDEGHKTTMGIIADYVTSKFHNLIYLDISYTSFWYSGKDGTINNIHNLKRILDHPSIIVVNISEYVLIDPLDSLLNERQFRKLIWIPEGHIERLEFMDFYIPNSIKHLKDEIITWHRRFYDKINPYYH
jgi:hypothetical protein